MNHIKASAPGSTMLLGEYTVLHHGWALVCAVDKRVYVTLTQRADDQIEIVSSLGSYKATRSKIEIVSPFQFVLASIKHYQSELKTGFTLTIESDFSEKIGLASSAAVTVATLAAITCWLEINYSSIELIQHARHIVQSVQGIGSGADVAACVLGGMVAYRREPFTVEKIHAICPFQLIYSGDKTPTSVVVKQVESYFANYPDLYQIILKAIDACTQQGISALKNQNNKALGEVMTIQQGLMQSLGVNTSILQGIVDELLLEPTILGAKISGSGLGDSVIALGELTENYVSRFSDQGVKRIPVKMTTEGVHYEKI